MGDMNWPEMGDGRNEQPGVVEAICELGYVDAWRKLHPTGRDYSWTNHNGTGTRVDYAFLSKWVAGRLAAAWYAHDEREAEVSDHCPLIVDLARATARRFVIRRNRP
jgi:exonuclease III